MLLSASVKGRQSGHLHLDVNHRVCGGVSGGVAA